MDNHPVRVVGKPRVYRYPGTCHWLVECSGWTARHASWDDAVADAFEMARRGYFYLHSPVPRGMWSK